LSWADAVSRRAVVFYSSMAQIYDDIRRRLTTRLLWRHSAYLCLWAVALCLADASFALTRAELYQATVPVPNRSEATHPAAFQAALKIVLVRVTGRRTAAEDPALGPLVNNASRYVQQYRDTPDSQLWVAFDGPALERWLTQNGQPLWGHERPATVVWLGVQTGPQAGTVVTAEDTSELKTAVEDAATLRGLPLVWPSAADLQKYHLDYSNFNGAGAVGTAAGSLTDVGHHLGGEGVLIGRATNATATAGVRWTFFFQDHSSEYSGTLEGINRAADTYAGLYAASGALMPVDIEVAGIENLHDYADVQAYLESQTFIAHVNVQGLSGDTVQLRLTTRGGVEPLEHALALNGRLQTLPPGSNGIPRFQLRR
jgi:hypothetical protein